MKSQRERARARAERRLRELEAAGRLTPGRGVRRVTGRERVRRRLEARGLELVSQRPGRFETRGRRADGEVKRVTIGHGGNRCRECGVWVEYQGRRVWYCGELCKRDARRRRRERLEARYRHGDYAGGSS